MTDGSAAAEAHAHRKRSHLDTAAHCDEEGLDFLPMVVEASGGGWGSDARRVWRHNIEGGVHGIAPLHHDTKARH